MRIENRPIDLHRPGTVEGAKGVKGENGGRQGATQPAAGVARSDQVQISDAGRALASQGESREALSPERIAEIRQRIYEGAYDSLAVVEEVARRMLQRGDI